MRPIEFRGKRIDDGEWIHGYLYRMTTGETFIILIVGAGEVVDLYEVDHSTVGEWAGLKDKNGKDIYEGDMLQSIYAPQKVVVEFKSGAFYAGQVLVSLNHSSTIEVIGNIHDKENMKNETN